MGKGDLEGVVVGSLELAVIVAFAAVVAAAAVVVVVEAVVVDAVGEAHVDLHSPTHVHWRAALALLAAVAVAVAPVLVPVVDVVGLLRNEFAADALALAPTVQHHPCSA